MGAREYGRRRRQTYGRKWPIGPDIVEHDRLTCSICGFPGIDVQTRPGGGFPTALVAAGTTYVWTNANDPISAIDKTVTPTVDSAQSCPFCGGTRFQDGRRGQGQ